jgi:hypothetical protein
VDVIPSDTQVCQAGSQIAHEGRGSTNIEIAIARYGELLKRSHIQPPRRIEINIGPILGIGRAVANVTAAVGERFEQSTRLLGKRMFVPVTGSV